MSRLLGKVSRLALVVAIVAIAATMFQLVAQEELPEVPRERTLITQGWDFYNQIPSPTNFHPYVGPLLHQRNILHYTVYESLFYYDYFTGEIIPWIAESYEYNDDFTEIVVNLREGVTWADGEQLTADDVVFTINMLKQTPELQLGSVMADWVDDVTAVDESTVRITLTRPGPRWATDIFATGQTSRFVVLPEHVWADVDAATFENFDVEQGWPLGTGPYRLVRSGDDSVIFDRRDSWWAVDAGLAASLPAPERIVYVPGTVESMPQQFISNAIDMGRSIPVGAWEAARMQNPALITWRQEGPVWGAPDGCVYRLAFNTLHPPFDDAEIRRAINFAIDRDEIALLGYEGSTNPTVVPLSSFQGVQAYTSQLQDLIDASGVGVYDPNQTVAILESKGYTRNEAGLWVNEAGETLQLNIQMEPGNPAGPVLAQQLQEAGFDVNSEVTQAAAFTDSARAGTFDLHLWVHCGSTYDPYLTLEHYHSRYAAPEGEAVTNLRAYTRYSNPELDELLNQMEQMVPSPDDSAYVELVRQAMEIYLTDLPDLTLAEERHVIPFSTTYWTGWPTEENPFTHPYIPWDGFNFAIHNLQAAQ